MISLFIYLWFIQFYAHHDIIKQSKQKCALNERTNSSDN